MIRVAMHPVPEHVNGDGLLCRRHQYQVSWQVQGTQEISMARLRTLHDDLYLTRSSIEIENGGPAERAFPDLVY